MESRTVTAELPSHKRPRSPSGDYSPTVSKMPKTQSNSLHINYLARQYPDNLPLVSTDDSLPNILRLIGEYDGVLQRHESIAGNLGACPLGPILMKRFERLFEGPPRVLKSNGKEGTNVTWLDVVEFAKSKPEQFNLEKTRNGVRVCQFYTKQCRVEISEEDYVLIASGMPQKLIPPQPIDEDEEKEVGVLEILEKNLQQITAMADSAAARARQLSYRLKSRRNAIVTRRENDRNKYSQSPPLHEHGSTDTAVNGTGFANPPSPPGGFVAVNTNRPAEAGDEHPSLSSQFMLNHPNTDNITIINGTNIKGASPTTRAELLKKFLTTADRAGRSGQSEAEGSSSLTRQSSRTGPRRSEASEMPPVMFNNSTGTVAIPNTPPSLLPQPKSVNHHERDDGGPFKLEMVARMEDLQRGERILPPCDRCRRLHMDCLKNLTACMGCTKKHAKCSWKDVKEEELRDLQPRQSRAHVDEQRDFARPAAPDSNHQDEHGADHSHPHHSSNVYPPHDNHVEPHPNPHNALVLAQSEPPSHPYNQHQTPREHATAPRRANSDVHIMLNHDQHPDTHHQHHHHPQQHQHQSHQSQHDRRSSFHHRNILHDNNSINNSNTHHRSNHHRNETDNDPDANSRLMQAIKDTVDHHSTRVQKHIRDGE